MKIYGYCYRKSEKQSASISLTLLGKRDVATKRANSVLGYVRKTITSRSRSVLLSTGEATPGMLCPVLGSLEQDEIVNNKIKIQISLCQEREALKENLISSI